MTASAVLWGAEHVELAEVASAPAGPDAAVAITRGRFAKLYSYVDPNEDVVAAVAGPRATLLVCADGHNGATASRRAVEEVLSVLGDDPPPGLEDRHWLALFGRVNEAVLAATIRGSQQPDSRTVLLVALVAGRAVSWASMGDAALVVAAPGAARGRQLNREEMRFVGYPMSARVLKEVVQRGSEQLADDEWVVLVTDGLSEFIAPDRPGDVIPGVLERADGWPEGAARGLVYLAGERGAGDNVAAAVARPANARR